MDARPDRAPAGDPPTFEPVRAASPGWVAVLLIAGPVLWVAALIVVAFALKYGEVVEIALGVVLVSFLAALAVLIPGRGRRVREEEAS